MSNYALDNSIHRAKIVLQRSDDAEEYVHVKIETPGSECWCLKHHAPRTWEAVNSYIAPCGPVRDHGDVLVDRNGERVVLEHHESGPEIVVCLALCTALVTLVKSVLDLVTVIVKARSDERRIPSVKVTITRRSGADSAPSREVAVEVEAPMSKKGVSDLKKALEAMMRQDGE